ncbi:MAG: MarR family winged helix-turn-helix transcriptional regulator [Acetivibrionales bacterium]|jgi:DNA-binding MarR family transcriptional regulator
MDNLQLRSILIASLSKLYEMKVFNNLAVFLQGEVHILWYLLNNPEKEINPSFLSDMLHVSRSRITAALTSLRKKGYVTMEMSEGDRRRMRVMLTPSGETYIRQKQNIAERYFDLMIEGLGEENVLELNRLIELTMTVMEDKVGQL